MYRSSNESRVYTGWQKLYWDSRPERLIAKGGVLWVSVLMMGCEMLVIKDGNPGVAAMIVVLSSLVFLTAVKMRYDPRAGISHYLRLKEQSWGFLAQSLVLAPAAAVVALAWPKLPRGGWYDRWYWLVGSGLAGVAIAIFLRVQEKKSYDVLQMESYDKIAHDLGATLVVIGGVVVYGAVPVIFAGSWASFHAPLVLGLVLIWLVFGVLDIIRTRLPMGHAVRLDRTSLHPQADVAGRPIVPPMVDVPMARDF